MGVGVTQLILLDEVATNSGMKTTFAAELGSQHGCLTCSRTPLKDRKNWNPLIIP